MGNLASNWRDQSSRPLSAEVPWRPDNLDELARRLLVNVSASGIAIAREDPEAAGTFVCLLSLGACVPPRAARVDPSSGISGRCVRERRTQLCCDTGVDPRVDRTVSERLGIRSLVAVPLLADSRCIGLIEAVSDRPGHFDETKRAVVESAAEKATALLAQQQSPSESPNAQFDQSFCNERVETTQVAALAHEIHQDTACRNRCRSAPRKCGTTLQIGQKASRCAEALNPLARRGGTRASFGGFLSSLPTHKQSHPEF